MLGDVRLRSFGWKQGLERLPVADERHAIGCDSANYSVEVVFLSSMSGVPVIFDRQTEQVLLLHVKDEGHFESTIPAAWYATEERLSRILGEIALGRL